MFVWITYEVNSCVARTNISQTLPDSASGTVHTTADQTMDTLAHNRQNESRKSRMFNLIVFEKPTWFVMYTGYSH